MPLSTHPGAEVWLSSALPQHPSAVRSSNPNAFVQPHLHQGGCSGGGHLGLNCQGCCGACSTPFSRLLQPSVRCVEDLGVVASGHRPLSISVALWTCLAFRWRPFSPCSCQYIGETGWPPSISRKRIFKCRFTWDSRHFLRFVFRDRVFQFKAAVLWPLHGSAGLHSGHGSCIRNSPFHGNPHKAVSRTTGSSSLPLRRPSSGIFRLSSSFATSWGIVVNPQKSNLVPSQVVQYLGVVIDAKTSGLLPSQERISKLLSTAAEFRSSASPPASLWLSLLGSLSSLAHLVPGGRLQMRSLQICLHRSWDRHDLEAPVYASMECLRDLQWWLHLPRLSLGVSLCQVSPDLHFWSDVGWGAHLDRQIASGLWDSHQAALSINARELLAVKLGLLQFQSSLRGRTVAVFCGNTTAVAYLRKEGGTRSPLLNALAQAILRWSESLSIRLAPQFLPGSNNVLADALSRPHQLPHSEWSLNMTVYRSLCRLWPVQIDLFATSENRRCSIYFSPFRDPLSAGTDAFLQSWDGLQAYAFPPVAIIPRVLAKLRASRGTELTLVAPHWAQRPWFSDLLQLSLAPPVILPAHPDLLRLPRSRHLYPALHQLSLHAWRLSSDLPGPRVSPPQ